jgi:hypothetical protein
MQGETTGTVEIRRANSLADIAPLFDLCRGGRLFDVQVWIAAGKPLNPPIPPAKGGNYRTPLKIAIKAGFHSLVDVLLRGGATQEPGTEYGSPISLALEIRRLDMVELLVQHGCDPRSVDMTEVFRSWDPKIIQFFLGRDADLVSGMPFATAFCERIRTALRPYKELLAKRPELQEQGNIALRHHCKEGDSKWVSLLLWAGCDPLKPGHDEPGDFLPEEYEGLSAVGFAALYDHFEILSLKPIRTRLAKPDTLDFLPYLNHGEGVEVLRRLLENGLKPSELEGGGSSLIQRLIANFGSPFLRRDSWSYGGCSSKSDSEATRDAMKANHMLARHCARWAPQDRRDIASSRKALLCMTPDYTIEFVWIMSKYKSCDLAHARELVRTPTMRNHIGQHAPRLAEIFSGWESTVAPQELIETRSERR